MIFLSPFTLTSASALVEPAAAADGRTATVAAEDITEFSHLSPPVKRLLEEGLALTQRNLPYKYGSSDPDNGGMDCSGTIHYLLEQAGLSDVPRDSAGLYAWVWQVGRFEAVVSSHADTFELKRLKPGDLLFWTGTYHIERDPPVTHVMIYLGTDRRSGRRLMVGASEGRTFAGKPRYGVSVFDFKLPGARAKERPAAEVTANDGESRFIGYGSVPGLEEAGVATPPSSPALKGSL